MPDVKENPELPANLTGFLMRVRELAGYAEALADALRAAQDGPGNGPDLAAAGSELAVGWSAKARAAVALWDAHTETIETRARSWGWAALTSEEKEQIGDIFAAARIADGAVAGVRDLLGAWAGSLAADVSDEDDLPYLRLALDHAILNDPDTRFAGKEPGSREWVRVEDAATAKTGY